MLVGVACTLILASIYIPKMSGVERRIPVMGMQRKPPRRELSNYQSRFGGGRREGIIEFKDTFTYFPADKRSHYRGTNCDILSYGVGA